MSFLIVENEQITLLLVKLLIHNILICFMEYSTIKLKKKKKCSWGGIANELIVKT